MHHSNEVLLIFLRHPEPGKSKTRLAPELGEVGAARLYRLLAEDVLNTCQTLIRDKLRIVACIEPAERMQNVQSWLGESISYRAQSDGDLGARLSEAFTWAFAQKAERVVAIGTDCVELDADALNDAFEALDRKGAVVGPTLDGGYYLIGLSEMLPEIFSEIPWSSDQTCSETLKKMVELNTSPFLLPMLSDVDVSDDLKNLPPRFQLELGKITQKNNEIGVWDNE